MRIYTKIIYFNLSAFVLFGGFSCSSDIQETTNKYETDIISLSAEIKETVRTRDGVYTPEGPIKGGTFILSYSDKNSQKALAYVNFDQTTDGIGYVVKPDGRELTWADVVEKPPFIFTLDNVDSQETSSVSFDENTIYKASLLDNDKGSNDLIWGSVSLTNTVPVIPFTLNHRMSLLCVEITVEADKQWNENLDLRNATVEITNLKPRLTSFNRSVGTVMSALQGDSPLTLISPEDPELTWETEPDKDNSTMVYITRQFIVPPQVLNTGNKRPELIIKIGEDVYSGYLPRGMSVQQEEGSVESGQYPEFLSGKFLTIHTTIEGENPHLTFLPVTYVDWVNEGSFHLMPFQAGIYTADNLISLMTAINSGKVYEMSKFGYQKDNIWYFQIWSNLELDFNQIESIDSSIEFEFEFHSHTVTITMESEENEIKLTEENDGPQILVEILKGTYSQQPK